MSKLVSVIITTFKTDGRLERAVKSVLEQTYDNVEIIVVDDNSPNSEERKKTEKIMSQFKDNSKISYLKHTKNMNGAAARNTGIHEIKGEYLTFLDDDDILLPTRIKTSVDALEKYKSYDGVYSSVIYMNDDKYTGVKKSLIDGNLQKELLLDNNFIGTGSNIFIRTKCLEKVQKFDSDFLRFQDVEFMIRFFDNYKLKHIDEILIVKDNSGENRIPNYEKMYLMVDMFLKKFSSTILKYGNETKLKVENDFYTILYNIAIKTKNKNNIQNSIARLKKYRNLTLKEKVKSKIYKLIPVNKRIILDDILEENRELLSTKNYLFLQQIRKR